ncbi:V-type proton ATPase subunit G-like [Diorhabda carinulata]|uniref:V-type proton ATPase subunit G-like n=1 Tax=Diorhabda sublineata TaxID=1163346 RepID=UPI0024E06ABE|nr:V-type proton ATPase subunit G-like [Diorhabda sublineata]XP_057669624.1 V-type proton ATPase subunit G-like [Diorhabda carinulata]
MASQSQGIQQLLVAEKRAAEKVSEARKRKTRRIKQAREEAAAEIELYRKERERQFREYEIKYMGSKEDAAAKIEKDTERYMFQLDESVKHNKEALILDLIGLAIDVKPEVHRNYAIMKTFNKI